MSSDPWTTRRSALAGMPSTTSTLAPPLLSGPTRAGESAAPPKSHVEERRAGPERVLVLEEPLASAAGQEALPQLPAPGHEPAPARLAKVHAVIVHHRDTAMLDSCLRSLLASEPIDLEVVVVLNHCLDPVPEIGLSSPRVHLLELAVSHGFGEANNLGVAFARRKLGEPDYYYFLNNDTVSRPDTLPLLAAELARAPRAAIAGPQTLIQSAPDFINSLGLNLTEDAWGWDEGIGIALCDYGPLPAVRRVVAVTGSALLVEAAAFHQIGGWSEAYDYYFEDLDLGIKAWKRGREVLLVPEAVIFHRISATMTGGERKFFFFWRNRLLLAGIHWPLRRLGAVLWRAMVTEVLQRRPFSSSELQRRALWGAVKKLPKILRERWRQRGSHDWWRFLHPPGSVPRISLPKPGEVPARLAAEAAAREAEAAAREAEAAPPAPPPAAEPAQGGLDAATPEPALGEEILERLRAIAAPAAIGRRLLLFGWSPLPFENQKMNYAPGTRSWQFAKALAADGHAVLLACAPIPGATFAPPPPAELEQRDGVSLLRLALPVIENAAETARLTEAFGPDAMIGAAPGPSAWAAAAAGELPLWVDFFGDPLAEGQAREAVYPGLESFGAYAGQVAPLLRRGDAFSAVSQRQRLALIGQLGLAGRLRGAAAGHELVEVLPCAAENESEAPAAAAATAEKTFLVFWSGGFNTWCDVPTLVEGLELAMDQRPELTFVATGGEIAGHDDRTARDFRERVAASHHARRFLLLGQLPRQEAESWLRRAQLALITEKKLYERELGSSGRVSGWLAAGKAILCSGCSELAQELSARELVLTYEAGDAASLAEKLVYAAAHPQRLRELAGRAADYARRHLTYEATTGPLRAWARQPRRAPGAAQQAGAAARIFLVNAEVRELESALESRQAAVAKLETERRDLLGLLEEAAVHCEQLETDQVLLEQQLAASAGLYHEMRAELGKIHQSKMWRIWMGYLGLRQRLAGLFGRKTG